MLTIKRASMLTIKLASMLAIKMASRLDVKLGVIFTLTFPLFLLLECLEQIRFLVHQWVELPNSLVQLCNLVFI